MHCLVRLVFQCTNSVARCLELLGKYKKSLHSAWSHRRGEDVFKEVSNAQRVALCENHFTVVDVPSSHSSLSMTLHEMYSSSISCQKKQVFLKVYCLNAMNMKYVIQEY